MIDKLTPEQEELLITYRNKWLEIGLSCEPTDYDKARWLARSLYTNDGRPKPAYTYLCSSPYHALVEIRAMKKYRHANEQVSVAVGHRLWRGLKMDICKQMAEEAGFHVRQKVAEEVGEKVINKVWFQVGMMIGQQLRHDVKEDGYELHRKLTNMHHGNHDGVLSSLDFFLNALSLNCRRIHPLIELAQVCGWWSPYSNTVILCERPSELHFDEQGRLHNPNDMAIKYPDGWGVYALHGKRVSKEELKIGVT